MNTLRLALHLTRRDLRAGELHLLALSLIIAVACLTSVGFLAERVERGLEREANQLLGGDLLLRADHPWGTELVGEARQRGLLTAQTILFTSMVATDEQAELAAVKVVEEPYPLRGHLRISDGANRPDRVAERMPSAGDVWLDPRLMTVLGVRVGDRVTLGFGTFRVAAVITFESDRGANFFSLLPRVLFNVADLERSGLLVEGSRASWRLHVAGAPQAVDDFAAWVRGRLGRGEAVESIENARPELRAALDQARRYLRLAALLAVVLASLAVGLGALRFMRRHLDACAVMRCLGASRALVVRIVIIEFLTVGILAALAGAGLGWVTQQVLVLHLGDIAGVSLPASGWRPFLQGLVVAVVLLAGFVLPQVLRLGRVSTLRVLRRELVTVDAHSASAWGVGSVALLAIVLWVADDVRLGALVAGGFVATFGTFALVAWAGIAVVVRGGRRMKRVGSGWRYGFAAIARRAGLSVLQISALGVGIAALVLLTLVQKEVLDSWRRMAPADAPNRFLINIQPDQRDALSAFFAERGFAGSPILPMIRGRWVAINGQEVRPEAFENARTRRLAEREFNLSYGTDVPAGNRISAGRWHADEREPQFSVEKGLAETFGLKVGDRVSFNVAGQVVEAPITSVRELAWDSMRVNFFFIAAPGMLEAAPASLITSFRQPPGDYAFTAELVARFPNVSVIDVDAVVGQLRAISDRLIAIVQAVSGFALLAGVMVLFAAIQATHDERARELTLLRFLGARNAQLRQALLGEFMLLGGLAAGFGVLGAVGLGWAVARYALHIPFAPDVGPVVLSMLAASGGIVLAAWLGTMKLRSSPLVNGLRLEIGD